MKKTKTRVKQGMLILLASTIGIATPALGRPDSATVDLYYGISAEIETEAKRMNADGYQKEIEEAEKKLKETQDKKRNTENKIKELTSKYEDIDEYLREIDMKQEEVIDNLAENEATIALLEQQIADTTLELEAAEAIADSQYEGMKRRIQYIYENGNTSQLELLLNATNLSDLLNQVEYAQQINEYDRTLYVRYVLAKEDVNLVKQNLETQLETAELAKSLNEQDMEYYQEIARTKSEALADYQAMIGASEDQLEEFMAQEKRDQEALTEVQKKEAERIRKQQEEERLRREKEERESGRYSGKDYSKVPHTGYASASDIPKKDVTDPNKMIWPLPGDSSRGSGFGPRVAPIKGASTFHKGVDIGGRFGAQIVASLAGKVVTAGYSSSGGNYIEIDHGNGYVTRYLHCSKLLVSKGQYVKQGEVIGLVGSTGISTAPHLHFTVVHNGVCVDPLDYVRY